MDVPGRQLGDVVVTHVEHHEVGQWGEEAAGPEVTDYVQTQVQACNEE